MLNDFKECDKIVFEAKVNILTNFKIQVISKLLFDLLSQLDCFFSYLL